ncbi:MAG: PEGA domain-containing protein [Patescibacteria group bacterium]|nr:PEGA domain-containing protein [Patescibacteria group bacterium]
MFFFITGYRFNFNEKKVTTIGSIYAETEPDNASIYLNDKLYKKETPVLINNLYPKKYNIRLEMEDRYPWQKTLDVEPQKSIVIGEVVLFKNNTVPEEIEKYPTQKLSTSGIPADFKEEFKDYKFPYYQTDNRILFYNNHEIWFYNLEDDTKNLVIREGGEIKNAIWHPSGAYIIYTESNKLNIIETDSRDYRNVYTLLEADIDDITTDSDGKNIYYKSGDKNFKLNIL